MIYTAMQIRKVCENKAGIEFNGNKELNGWIYLEDGTKVARVTVPKGRKEIPKGTLGSIRRQLRLDSNEQLKKFIDCSMSRDQYIEILKAKNKTN